MNAKGRFSTFTVLRNAFFSEVGIGISANTTLLFHILMFFLQCRLKPTDLSISHLALVHILMLLTVRFMATDTHKSPGVWDGLKCKVVLYTYRVMWGLSISTTCLRSIFQAITLSPRSSYLAKFKHKSSWHSLYSFSFLCVLNMLTSVSFLFSTVAPFNVTSASLMFVTESCSLSPLSYSFKHFFSTLVTFWGVSFIGLMALSSGYMVNLLCRHRRQTQYLHRTNVFPRTIPEEKAIKIILWRLAFFVVMYVFDSITSFSLVFLWNNDQIFLCFQMLINNDYATISPFMLICTDKRIIMLSMS